MWNNLLKNIIISENVSTTPNPSFLRRGMRPTKPKKGCAPQKTPILRKEGDVPQNQGRGCALQKLPSLERRGWGWLILSGKEM